MPTNSEKKVLIVPPGLNKDFNLFKDHYEVAEGAPILILGPTGVGKTLFYQIYKNLFLSHKGNEKKPIIRANCAHFGNKKSDPNIAHSELFGVGRNIFTGVDQREGLVQRADGGVLFLEEIGELPIAVQAMLLTFIEDKQFRRFGDPEEYTSDCCIVAATNNEGTLREDFKNRFFPFHVPPVFERRQDVLYYLYDKWPSLVASLKKFEILLLLAYNWPGNVREIERIARLIRRYQKKKKRIAPDEQWQKEIFDNYRTDELDLGGSSLYKDINLSNELQKRGADVKYLESILNEYGIGLVGNRRQDDFSFANIETAKPEYTTGNYSGYEIRVYKPYMPFEKAYEGYQIYCSLFLQDYFDNKNVLKDLTECFPAPPLVPGQIFEKRDKSKFNKLMKNIFKFLSGLDVDKNFQWPASYLELEEFLQQYSKIHPSNDFLSSLNSHHTEQRKISGVAIDEILALTKKELLYTYYENLLKLENGNVSAARRKAGLPDSTFRDELKKHGLSRKK